MEEINEPDSFERRSRSAWFYLGIGGTGLAFALLVWWLCGLWQATMHGTVSHQALIGDSYGFANSLISAFALAGVVVALIIQAFEFSLAAKERREALDTQLEISKTQQDALDSQVEVARIQRLQTLLSARECLVKEDPPAITLFQDVIKRGFQHYEGQSLRIRGFQDIVDQLEGKEADHDAWPDRRELAKRCFSLAILVEQFVEAKEEVQSSLNKTNLISEVKRIQRFRSTTIDDQTIEKIDDMATLLPNYVDMPRDDIDDETCIELAHVTAELLSVALRLLGIRERVEVRN